MRTDLMIVLKRGTNPLSLIGEISGRDGIVHDFDNDLGVIEATIACEHVGAIGGLPGVAYIRPVLTYADAG